MPRKPFSLRVPDPGASGMAIRVAAIGDLLARMKASGVRVISTEWRARELEPDASATSSSKIPAA